MFSCSQHEYSRIVLLVATFHGFTRLTDVRPPYPPRSLVLPVDFLRARVT